MANWKLYTQDVAAGLYGGCTDSGTTGTAHYAVDSNQGSVWAPGTTATRTWTVTFGASRTVKCVGIGAHNMYGTGTITIKVGTTTLWSGSAISGEDMLLTHSGIAGAAMTVEVTGFGIPPRIGTISALTDAGTGYGIIELAPLTGAPAYPIGMGVDTGAVVLPTAAGAVYQGMRRPARTFEIPIQYLKHADASGSYRRIEQSMRLPWTGGENYGWRKGIWITTDEYDASTDYRGYYVRPMDPGSGLSGSIVAAGGITTANLLLQEFPRPI